MPLIPGFGIGENGRDPGIRDPGIANIINKFVNFCYIHLT